ncbi:hypothetical protein M3G50_07480 [Brachybacterium muris]|uniref:hypothetical protein n=1 Tax=Brachybacterium muris TaxID=219301 RepID=UPI0021A59F78|nr:hypothetical protein [Brachybacterium muris]MCT1430593.1 hypothetical protein [Brachybacterium muris]
MSFRKLLKPKRSTGTTTPTVTIGLTGNARQVYMGLNSAARKALGDPAAIHLEWDGDRMLMRIVVSSLEDPAAYKITKQNGRISVTGVLRELDLIPVETITIPATKDTRVSLVVDLTDMASATVTPIRGAA